VDENAIFRTIETMRSIADEAVLRSKMARRQSERRARAPSRESAPQGALAEVDVLEDAPSGVFDASRIFPFEEWG